MTRRVGTTAVMQGLREDLEKAQKEIDDLRKALFFTESSLQTERKTQPRFMLLKFYRDGQLVDSAVAPVQGGLTTAVSIDSLDVAGKLELRAEVIK